MGCTEAEVSRRLSVLRLPEDILNEYRERSGEFSRSLLIEIAAVDDPDRQRALWQKAREGLTIRALRAERKAEGNSRHRPLSLKAVSQHLGRMVQEIERMDEVRRQLKPEHREQLSALRRKIDALLEG